MRIKTLGLTNFRNFRQVDEIVFPHQQNLLVAAAPNATGKTNFLEAVHFLLRGKSFRALPQECVKWGEDYFQLEARAILERGDTFLSARFASETRTLRLEEDEQPVSLVRFYRDYPFVLFLPEDSFLFVRGPAMRRNFLNSILITSPQYLAALVQYYRVLRQRNAALKTAKSPHDVEVWTGLLLEHARVIWDQRQSLIEFFNTHLTEHFSLFGGWNESAVVELSMGIPRDKEDLLASFNSAFNQEIRYQYTMYGPHRDDMQILYGDKPVKTALSRGQMRLLVLVLKILSWKYIKQVTGQDPILLMDEVFSELDVERQRLLFTHLPATQTILTCTAIPAEFARRDDVFMLDLRRILQPSDVALPTVAVAST